MLNTLRDRLPIPAVSQWLRRGRGLAIESQISVAAYDVGRLEARWPDWHEYGRDRRRSLLDSVTPDELDQTHNVALGDQINHLVDLVDINQSVAIQSPDRIAIGDGTTAPQASDTGLQNEIARVTIDATNDNSGTTEARMEATRLLTSGEQNGTTIAELALVNDSTNLYYNRSSVGPVNKTSSKEVTLDVDLIYSVEV